MYQLSREVRKPIILPFGGPDLNGDALALDPAKIAEPLPECLHEGRASGAGFQISDPGDFRRWLRLDGERRSQEANGTPSGERAPVNHWMTSSAPASTTGHPQTGSQPRDSAP